MDLFVKIFTFKNKKLSFVMSKYLEDTEKSEFKNKKAIYILNSTFMLLLL